MNPGISILIRTFNSAGTLPDVLARLKLCSEDEIIVVDSGSRDQTVTISEKYHARILFAEPPFNYSKSLNLGFQAAKNSWVLVLSSHCVPQADNLLELFRAAILNFPNTVAVAYGKGSLIESQKISEEKISYADKTTTATERQQIYGGNGLALYRRECWQRQPFDETLRTAEDLVWFLSALAKGAHAAHVPQARALYRNQGNLRYMFRKGWWESRLMAQLTDSRPMNLFDLAINLTSLLKKWMLAQIPFHSLLRHAAHAVGAYLSPKFSDPKKNPNI